MISAAKGDSVKVHYTGRLSDGTVFDKSPEDRPLLFIIGRKEVIEGFDEAVEGMCQGESKTAQISSEKAYGASKPELIEQIDRSAIDESVDLQVGGQLQITKQDDSVFCVMVRELTADKVTLDANHPLAGKDLIFDINLLEVKKPPEKQTMTE